ncbi:MAG: YbhB/YbcL family Raf kinase inhibitor-like protein [Rickettsiales bacterium]
MYSSRFFTLFVVFSLLSAHSTAAEPLNVKVQGIAKNNDPIPVEQAYCRPTDDGKSTNGVNRRPSITWSKGPAGTKSYAIVMVDPDVPTDFTKAGKEGKTLPADMKRQNFYHWVQVDIPATAEGFPSGSGNEYPQQQPRFLGKPGLNSYAKFYTDKPKGEYTGYDGSCPPWNDERVHHYHYKVFALDVETLGLPKKFEPEEAMRVIKEHTLAEGELIGTYTLNSKLRK